MRTDINGVKFERAGRIERTDARLQFKLDPAFLKGGDQCEETGWVYLWAKEGGKRADPVVCYVGATTKRLVDRCGGQKGGFRRSKTGKRHAKRINSHLCGDSANEMVVYAKHAKRCKILEVDDVSLVMAEETAMITKLKDCKVELWNFEPQGKTKKK